jgi:hypothetical protein
VSVGVAVRVGVGVNVGVAVGDGVGVVVNVAVGGAAVVTRTSGEAVLHAASNISGIKIGKSFNFTGISFPATSAGEFDRQWLPQL